MQPAGGTTDNEATKGSAVRRKLALLVLVPATAVVIGGGFAAPAALASPQAASATVQATSGDQYVQLGNKYDPKATYPKATYPKKNDAKTYPNKNYAKTYANMKW